MFLVVLSKQPVSATPFLNSQLKTTICDIGNLSLFIARDDKFSKLHKTDSRICLTEAIINPKKGKMGLENFSSDEFVKNLVSYYIVVDLERAEIHVGKPFLSGRKIYYYLDKNESTIYLSSHIRLLKQAGVLIDEDRMSVAEYMVFGDVIPPKTLFKDIKNLSNGQSLKVEFKRNKLSLIIENFGFPLKKIAQPKEIEVSNTIIKTLRSTLRRLKQHKGRIALAFSGGIDSTIIAKIMNDEIGDLRGYSFDYPFETKEQSTENYNVETAGKAIEIESIKFTVSQKQYAEGLIESILESEIPQTYLNTPVFAAFIKNSSTADQVIVFGHGADSLFGFYSHFRLQAYTEGFNSSRSYALKRALAITLKSNSYLKMLSRGILMTLKMDDILTLASNTSKDLADPNHFLWQSTIFADEDYVRQRFNISITELINIRKEGLKELLNHSPYDLISFYDLELKDCHVLIKVGEKYGKRLLFPFYTDALVEYAFRIPWRFKLIQPKYALRLAAMELDIPEYIVKREKMGMNLTQAEAYELLKPCIPLCENVCSNDQFKRIQTKNWKKFFTFWFMVNYSIWHALFIENVNPEDLKTKLNKLLEKNTQFT